MEFRVLPRGVAELTRRTMSTVADNMARAASRNHSVEEPVIGGMFGKSGTAKIVRPGGKGYFERQYNSSFIAGAPLDDPRLVVLVVIDDPGPARIARRMHYGSHTAGPVVLRVMQRSLAYLGMTPLEEPAVDAEKVAKVD
jgi:cell division protein FtsI/penicillin-binding protein 2